MVWRNSVTSTRNRDLTVELPNTSHSQLASIGQSLGRSLQRHLVDNDVVKSAFAELAFEIQLARQMSAPVLVSELLEPTI